MKKRILSLFSILFLCFSIFLVQQPAFAVNVTDMEKPYVVKFKGQELLFFDSLIMHTRKFGVFYFQMVHNRPIEPGAAFAYDVFMSGRRDTPIFTMNVFVRNLDLEASYHNIYGILQQHPKTIYGFWGVYSYLYSYLVVMNFSADSQKIVPTSKYLHNFHDR